MSNDTLVVLYRTALLVRVII